MKERLWAFAGEFDARADKLAYENDGQRGIHHPLVFAFIGDKSLDALTAVYEWNETKWSNSRGVVYLHLYTEKTLERDNVFGFRLDAPIADRKTVRPELHRRFHDDSVKLAELNRTVRQLGTRLAEFGRVYASFQQVNIAVVTMADDPCNVVLPEVALLLKAVLGESFQQIQTDLHGLIREKQGNGDFAYSASVSVAFMRELERIQDRRYSFSAPLQVTEDGIRLLVEHKEAPLFDLVYLLSDKNEQGLFVEGSMEANYEIICSLCLLKNRKTAAETDRRLETYNNQHYKQHIGSGSGGGGVYSTAGFSKVKRPNKAIALTVLHHLTQSVTGLLKERSKIDRKTAVELLQADSASIERRTETLMPERGKLEEMNALLASPVSFDEVKSMTLAEAEEAMYGRHAGNFFREQFADRAQRKLEQLDLEREGWEALERNIIGNPRFGVYAAYAWTNEKEDAAVVYQELRQTVKETAKQLEEGRHRLEALLGESVDMQPFRRVPFMKKSTLKHFSRYLFEHVYGERLELLYLEMKLALLRRYEAVLVRLHERVSPRIEQLHELENRIREVSRQSVSEADDYLGRNISEYYASVVQGVIKDLQGKRGDEFWFEDRYIGGEAIQFKEGAEPFLERLIELCRREVFLYEPFRESFEDELIRRANVTVRFDDRDQVLSKEQLFRDLYDTLRQRAAVHLDVYNYTQKHRYEEHYFFGDADSEFIRYAFEVDRDSRTHKLGCVHENRNSGIEKLILMGGFRIEDLLVFRNGRKYYDSYRENGYQFHAVQLD
ncbi:hypothetical protein [Paenibacillus oceani]|uniref:Transcription initiation factor TFIID n=1 Tax=Paenibacillus oceani TaxID=2772510 RepID=A0A927H332_9BACL|nr:hypothetical protein [Paenibacillus oceani]MBD2866450.1 hypothetical protein [Paenibacillus oceani]